MNPDAMPVTTNVLKIRNPYRVYGAIVFATGCILGLVVLKRLPAVWESLPGVVRRVQQIAQDPDALRKLQSEDLLASVILGFWGLFFVRAAIHALTSLVRGMSRMLIFFVPAEVPGPLDNAEATLQTLFLQRSITAYSAPTFSMRVIGGILSDRFRYARGECRELCENLCRSIPRWLFVLFLLSVPRLLPARIVATLAAETGIAQRVLETWPFPVHLAVVAGFVTLCRVLGVLSSVPRTPRVELYEGREHLQNAGNPVDFYNHVETTAVQVRHGTFANRRVVHRKPLLGVMHPGETSQFDSRVAFETQPLPVWSGLSVSAVILDLAGGALRCAGYAAIIDPGTWMRPDAGRLGPVELIYQVLAALVAIRLGARFLDIGWRLHQAFRFESDVFDVSLTGSYTSSSIGLGDGRGGQYRTGRETIQSDTYVQFYGATIVTETLLQQGLDPLKCPRTILDSRISATSRQRQEHLLQAMIEYVPPSTRLPIVDTSEEGVQRIIMTNAMIAQLNQGLNPGSAFPRAVPGTVDPAVLGIAAPGSRGSLPLTESDDSKDCPECGETVKRIAKKCRFCGHRFDGGAANGNDDASDRGAST